ncbi:hypothetical protein PRZ48_005356 [Zasmidium cellare]|uniref:Amine oxidase n=1 Tax=Zasmidium cellare TaxID=395010 RepID=A0ABR0ESK0_ZASCE|nr:hypothetical protein PRZ48_005356 [Zasmidium cellare]
MQHAWNMSMLLSLFALVAPVPTFAHILGPNHAWGGRSSNIVQKDVVVIGGGAAGTYATVRLQQEGKSVALIEKKNRLGGHVDTYIDPTTGNPFDYGVIYYGNSSVTRNFFDYVGVEMESSLQEKTQVYANFNTGAKVANSVVANETGNFQAAIGAWMKQLEKYPWLTDQTGFHLPATIPEELFLPFGEYIEKYNLGGFTTLLSYTAQQGNLLETPTFYFMKWLNIPSSGFGGIWQKDQNNQKIYDAAFNKLGGASNVYLSSKVDAVRRNSWGVEVCFSTPSGQYIVRASQLIMAIPPKIDNLGFLDISSTEQSLFMQLQNNYISTGVVLNSGLPDASVVINFDTTQPFGIPPAPVNPVLSGASLISNAAFTQWASPNYTSPDAIEAGMLADVDRLQKSLNFTVPAGTKPTLAQVSDHSPYFIHVSEEAIKSGFYDKVNALQGQKRTWWTGATFESEDTANIWNFTNVEILPRVLKA